MAFVGKATKSITLLGTTIILLSSSVQAFPKRFRSRAISSSTTLLFAMSDSNNNNNSNYNQAAAGCEDGVCVPLKQKGPTAAKNPPNFPIESNTNKNKIKIDIISDTMCPWCWVGKRNMEQALKEMPDVEAEINWLPFFLDRSLPEPHGKPVEEYYVGNYGDPKAGDRMKPSLVRAGKKCGIDFETKYIHLTHYRPTIRSHRLIHLAKTQGKQDAMVEELFRMYYEEGKHLNSIEHLVESAQKVDLEGADDDDNNNNNKNNISIEAYLKSDQDEKDVFSEADKAKRQAQGVPTFLFTKPGTKLFHTFSGGQPPSAFQQVFTMFGGASSSSSQQED